MNQSMTVLCCLLIGGAFFKPENELGQFLWKGNTHLSGRINSEKMGQNRACSWGNICADKSGKVTGYEIKEPGYYEMYYEIPCSQPDCVVAIADVTNTSPIFIEGSVVSGSSSADRTRIKTVIAITDTPKYFEIRQRSNQLSEPSNLSASFEVKKLD